MLPKVESSSGCLVGMSGDSTIVGNDLAASNQLNGKNWKGKVEPIVSPIGSNDLII